MDEAQLHGADLREAFFNAESSLRGATFAAPQSRAACLADVQWGDANLAVVDWAHVPMLGDEQLARDSKSLHGKEAMVSEQAARLTAFETAVRANRQLAVALREQGLHEVADQFAYRAQVLQRKVLFRQKSIEQWAFSLFLWAVSGYGYRLRRILAWYLGVLLLFTFLYWLLGVHSFPHEAGIQALWDSFLVSLSAIHGRTIFEQLVAWSPASWVAAIESVIGIVIEGVFVAMLVQRYFGGR